MLQICSRFRLGVSILLCGMILLLPLLDITKYIKEATNIESHVIQYSQLQTTTKVKSKPLTMSSAPYLCDHDSFSNESSVNSFLTVRRLGRMGNNMFQYASLLGLAKSNNRIPFILPDSLLSRMFRISHIRRVSNPKKWRPLIREKAYAVYDSTLNCLPPGNLTMRAYLQSYRYFDNVQDLVRSEFEFLPYVKRRADEMRRLVFRGINDRVPFQNSTLVGVHVRRGDKTWQRVKDEGETTTSVGYFKGAFDLMREKYGDVRFLIASDDRRWVQTFLEAEDVTVLPHAAEYVHLCVLSRCDHVIMSTGTFGWWAGFLAGGDVIYFNQPIVPGSLRSPYFDANDHFPKEWIGLGPGATVETF